MAKDIYPAPHYKSERSLLRAPINFGQDFELFGEFDARTPEFDVVTTYEYSRSISFNTLRSSFSCEQPGFPYEDIIYGTGQDPELVGPEIEAAQASDSECKPLCLEVSLRVDVIDQG